MLHYVSRAQQRQYDRTGHEQRVEFRVYTIVRDATQSQRLRNLFYPHTALPTVATAPASRLNPTPNTTF